MFWPKKVCFRDGRSPKTYQYVFGDFSCHADIGESVKYFYYEQNLVRKAFKYCFMYFLSLRRLKNGPNGPIYMGAQKNLSPLGWPPYLGSWNNIPGPP
jgi:hypothetical protein